MSTEDEAVLSPDDFGVTVWPYVCDVHDGLPAWASCARCGRFVCRRCHQTDAITGHARCERCALPAQARARDIAGVEAPTKPADDHTSAAAAKGEPRRISDVPAAIGRLVLRPAEFFRHMDPKVRLAPAFLLGVVCYVLGTAMVIAWMQVGLAEGPDLEVLREQVNADPRLFFIVASPFAAAVEILLFGIAVHLTLGLMRATKAPFTGTLKIVSYAMVSKLLLLVPSLGGLLSMMLFVGLLSIGTRQVHQSSFWASVIAAVLPVVILSGLGFAALG